MISCNILLWVIAFLTASVVSYFFSFGFIKAAQFLGFVDVPDSHKFHKTPTPLLGGVGVFFGTFAGMIVLRNYCQNSNFSFSFLLVSSSSVFILGVFDDKFSFRPFPKLIGLIFVSLIPGIFAFILSGNFINSIVLSLALFFFINSFNLLDNVDGLCSTIGLSVLISAFIHLRNPYIIPVAGGIAGFLVWNWPKAKIFLGDAGSLIIGGFCVVFVLMGNEEHLIEFKLLPVFWVPIYDTFSVIVIRLFEKRSILIGGKDHFSHRLMKKGMSNSKLNILLGGSTIIVGVITLFLPVFISVILLPVILIVVACLEFYWKRKFILPERPVRNEINL